MQRLGVLLLAVSAVCFVGAANVFGQTAPSPGHAVVSINFDDGYESAYQNAWPILQKAGLTATWFVITHHLNQTGFLTTQQVLALQAAGNEIGSHTQTHPFLSQLTADQQTKEIVGSFDDLVALGIHPTFFAYPYGDFNANAVALARSMYVGARTVNAGFVQKTGDPLLMNAYTVESTPYHIYCVDDIEKVINQAQAGGNWLILVFHRVNDDRGDGINAYSITIQQTVNYLIANKIPVVTMTQGLKLFTSHP
jgi:peptidoglycan/xylan/chitin deacetylase (PgdA/CDA1 family)